MKTLQSLRSATLGVALLSGAPLAHADVITDWNQTAIEVMKAANVAGNPWTRDMAMMNVAMSDAVNTVQGRYTRFIATGPAQPNASAEAAAAAAAHEILARLVPAQKAKTDEAYTASLKAVPEGRARSDGVALGEQIAATLYADRSNDATDVPDTYRPVTTPGIWIPTQPPVFPQYALAKPWGLKSADQFRPGPPPALSSALYARDFNETKELGAVKSTKRTPEQAEAVKFWTQTNFTPSWFQAAAQVSAARGLNLADNARLFALLAMGLGNCYILEWDAKFHYNSWRPITAIRNGDLDGNNATERDASWTPLNATPMHPEYPSAAGIVGGAGAGILQSVFGSGPASFTVTDLFDPKLQRRYASFAQMADEQSVVRVWGGIHFRNSLEVGTVMGKKITDQLVGNYITPARQTMGAAQ
jgi:hypothetical protein